MQINLFNLSCKESTNGDLLLVISSKVKIRRAALGLMGRSLLTWTTPHGFMSYKYLFSQFYSKLFHTNKKLMRYDFTLWAKSIFSKLLDTVYFPKLKNTSEPILGLA